MKRLQIVQNIAKQQARGLLIQHQNAHRRDTRTQRDTKTQSKRRSPNGNKR